MFAEPVRREGGGYYVSFLHGGERHDLGAFATRDEAVSAHTRRVERIAAAADLRRMHDEFDVKDHLYRASPIANESLVSPVLLASVLSYQDGVLRPSGVVERLGERVPRVRVRGVVLLAHRVVWCLVRGVWPTESLGWRNWNTSDFRYENLAPMVEVRAARCRSGLLLRGQFRGATRLAG